MKNNINKKLVIIIIIIVTSIIINIFTRKTPYEEVEGRRDGILDYSLISSNKTDEGILLYTSGVVNKVEDNVYYVDMVRKSLTGYKWVGGGGHINRDSGESNKDFIISMQLLNEEQNITPTAFGIVLDEKIIDVRIDIPGKSANATIYDGRDKNERLYVAHIARDIADIQNVIVKIMYTDGSEIVFLPSDKDMERLQEGRQLYINEEKIEKQSN